ncbi:hypothetical protein C361_05484 [Cryptococcus neoformans Tu259-1]|uniref:Rad21/Rec8-like protein N-terminal domain-containing protein n=1 Tax=Cryptococcus neoformans Tu259-1 TaxID=1230072 RepID=A0A854Q704_CRYNE|nr:hypothetical protein C361_05484 [Cryptococcus neoformans var. grubii Tu259-1]
MFFSDDLLTSKKGSFGIVWLMATLGPRNKKITRKQLATVDLARTCDLIAEPPEPMALRLSGALLVGVARVYNQSFDMFYSDVNAFHSNLRRSIATDFSTVNGGTTSGLALGLPGEGRSRPEQITLGGVEFDWETDWTKEFGYIDWNNPLGAIRKRRASSVISYSQATPISERHRDDDERHEEDDSEDEGYEWEVARQVKRKKYSASSAATTLHRTPLHSHAPSNSLYTGPDLTFNEEVDLGLNLDFEVPLGANDSFSGPSGRDFDIPFAQLDDYDIGLNFEGFGEARPDEDADMGPPIIYDVEAGAKYAPYQVQNQQRSPNRQPSIETVEQDLKPMKKRAKRLKTVTFDMALEIDEEEERHAKKTYVERMEKEKRDAELKEVEKQIAARVGRMVDGAGGLEFFDLEMDDWFSHLTHVPKFKWEQDLTGSKKGNHDALDVNAMDIDIQEPVDGRPDLYDNLPPMAEPDGYVYAVFGDIDLGQHNDYGPIQYGDYDAPIRDRSVGRGSEALDLEYARRESVQSGNLPWEVGMMGNYTPGFPDMPDTSFTPGSLKLSIMTPQEVRLRAHSRSGSLGGHLNQHRRIRSSSLMSDRPDDDPLMLALKNGSDLDVLPDELDLENIMSSETQEARLADLPEAFRPELLATLEKQCRDFFSYVEKRMLTLDKQEVEFNELVPEKSSKHIAAVAFYDCLTLATKKILTINQPEPWEDINIQFAVKNP